MKLTDLYTIILDRKKRMPENSYVVSLLNNPDKMLQKIGEEATELIIAGKNESKTRVIEEASDLLFHTIVLLVNKGIKIEEIENEFENRSNPFPQD